MKGLKYTQKTGFTVIDTLPEWDDEIGNDLDLWLKKAGFDPQTLSDEGSPQRYYLAVYERAEKARHRYGFIALLEDPNNFDFILIPNRGDLLALKALLAPRIALNLVETVVAKAEAESAEAEQQGGQHEESVLNLDISKHRPKGTEKPN